MGFNPFLVGWGKTSEDGTESPVPMQVQIPIIENKECKETYYRLYPEKFKEDIQYDDRIICAGFMDGGKDGCQSDSGGPLVLPIFSGNGKFPFYQIGIISYSDGCARANTPSVNTNVQYHAVWIKNKLK